MRALWVVAGFISAVWAQPYVSVGNAASPLGGIAPGSIVGVYGFGEQPVSLQPDLSNAQVTLDGLPLALIRRVSDSTLWAVIPTTARTGEAALTLKMDGRELASTEITIQKHAPALFARSALGDGPALATNSLTNPGAPGQYVTLWGTGLGDAREVIVELGGRSVVSQYAGHHPEYAGLDQINFQVPEGAWLGCYVPVTVRIGEARSNEVTLSISESPDNCPHPLGLNHVELEALDSGGSIPVGRLSVGAASVYDLPVAALFGVFAPPTSFSVDVLASDAVFRYARIQQPDERFLGCRVFPRFAWFVILGGFSFSMDAGDPATLIGPDGVRRDASGLSSIEVNPFGAVIVRRQYHWPDLESPGPWQLSAPGGTHIGAFQQGFTVPPPIRDLNARGLSALERTNDASIRWDPSGYGPRDVFTATLYAGGGAVQCRTHAWKGTLTLPALGLSQLPADSTSTLSVSVTPSPASRVVFRVPLKSGDSAAVVVDYSRSERVELEWR